MATENVVINFTSNADQLKPTVDLLVKMGQITAKDAEEFKKLSTETTKYSQAAQGAGESAKKLTDTLGQEMAIAQGVADALIEGANKFKAGSAEKQAAVQKETLLLRQLLAVSEKTVDPQKQKEITGELVKQAQVVKGLIVSVGGIATSSTSLRSELFAAREQLSQMKLAGQENSEEFKTLAERAAKIKAELDNTNKTLQALNPDAKFNSLLRLGTGVAGAFTAAQGAMALFGEESEDVGKAILKVQAALALTQGLNSVLQLKDTFKDLRVVLGITTAAQTTYNTASKAGAVTTNLFAAAQQRLTATLFASPLAPLVVVLGAVAAAMFLLSEATDEEAASQERLNQALEKYEKQLKELEEDAQNIRIRVTGEIERQIDLLTAQGGKEIEIFELKKAAITAELRELARIAGIRGSLTAEELERQRDLRNKTEVIELEKTAFIKRESEKRGKIAEDLNERIFQEQLRGNLLLAESDEDLVRRKLLNLDLEFNRRLEAVKKGSGEERLLVEKFANDRAELEKQLDATIAKNREAALKERLAKEKQLLEQQFNELEINLRRAGLEGEALDKALKELSVDKLEQLAIAAEKAGEDTSALRLQIQRLKDELNKVEPKGDKGFLQKLFPNLGDKEIAALKEVLSKAEEVFFEFFDAIAAGYRANAEALEEQKQRQIEGYDEEAEALELANERKLISDGQLAKSQEELAKRREATEKALNKRIAEEKRKAFIAEKAASIIKTIISGAEGAVRISEVIPFPGSAPFIAAYSALVAAQVALIASQPIPKFARGVIGLKGRGTGTSDSIPAMLSAGESVMTAKETSLFKPTLEAIRANRVNPELLNNVAVNHQFGPVEAYMDGGKLIRSQRKVIPQQADAIGRAVARYMKTEAYYSPLRS